MKKITVFLVILAGCAGPAFAQQPDQKKTAQQQKSEAMRRMVELGKKEGAQIQQLIKDYQTAFKARDLDGIMAIYDPEVVAFDITPPLKFKGAPAYRESWKKFLDAYEGPIDMEIKELSVSFSQGVAFSHNLERFTGKLKNGQQSEMWVRVTDTYMKKNGKWRIVHEHVSVPIDFESGKALLDLKP
jgi:uncharacterized protein (TIGR02246 family)